MTKHSMQAAVLLASLAAATGAIAADPITLKPAPPYSGDPASKLGVIDIVPGMPADAVKQKLKDAYGSDARQETSALTYGYRSVSVRTPMYLSALTDASASGEAQVYMSPPNSGSVVTAIKRHVIYGDPATAPKFDVVMSSLKAKYGRPTCTIDYHYQVSLAWYFGSSQLMTKAPGDGVCWPPSAGPINAEGLRQKAEAGIAAGISALVGRSSQDDGRASELTVEMTDDGLQEHLITDAIKQLNAAAQAIYSKTAIPDAAPKL